MEPNSGGCGLHPSVMFLMLTLLATTAATAMLCAAIMTDHWEYITWDRGKLEEISRRMGNGSDRKVHYDLDWLLDGQVARVLLEPRAKRINVKQGMFRHQEESLPALFLVPVHGGIWTLCTSLTEEQKRLLLNVGFSQSPCMNYLTPELMREEGVRTDWQHRMQNLSISCALVCLIILCSSALVGAFGVTKHQISAVLVTGVMYLLAATFAMFTLTIIHFKRSQSRADCPTGASTFGLTVDGVVTSNIAQDRPYYLGRSTEYFTARILTTGWSLHLGWGGVAMCVLVSILWIVLSKIMRYNPLTAMLTGLTVL